MVSKERQAEYKRKSYQKHKEKYRKRRLERRDAILKYMKEYYKNNREKLILSTKRRLKSNNYLQEKSPEQIIIRSIKRRTRQKYPLYKALKCEYCDNGATEHHHYTMPIEVDKFNFICHNCHQKM